MSVEIQPGEVVLVIGPSGSGKTTFLNLLLEGYKSRVNLRGKIKFPKNYQPGSFQETRSQKPLIEVLGKKDVASALHLMGLVGLSDAFIYLKRFSELSKGQQYRAMLAHLIARGCNIWLMDEFCANLDPVTANVVADKLQHTARKLGATIIAATPHCSSFLSSFRPDKVIQLTSAWEHSILNGKDFCQAISQGQILSGEVPCMRLLPEFIVRVRRDEKHSTIRKGRRSVQPGLLLFESDDDLLAVNVVKVVYKRFCDLTEDDAHNDGFESLGGLQKRLKIIGSSDFFTGRVILYLDVERIRA